MLHLQHHLPQKFPLESNVILWYTVQVKTIQLKKQANNPLSYDSGFLFAQSEQ